jgi:hypothetical protein
MMRFLENKWFNLLILLVLALIFSGPLARLDSLLFNSSNPLFGMRTLVVCLLVFSWYQSGGMIIKKTVYFFGNISKGRR